MTFEEYVEQLKERVKDFEATYGAYSEDNPENWPKEFPSSADWGEQFDSLT